MIKCKECGFESDRLQWTHFKYKCTGRFTSGTEYRKIYPGSQLVSPELAKKTAVTEARLIEKYGIEVGIVKWDEYKKKQAKSNSYDYKREKHGWSKDQFNEYNASRSQTLSKMIERHGEIAGAAKWETYCLRQAHTNTKQYFIDKHGESVGTEKYIEVNQKKKMPHDPVLLAAHLAITVDEATEIILARFSKSHSSKLESEFTQMLEQEIGPLDHTSTKSPYGKWSVLLNTYVVFDIKHKQYIIEFNGDYWHANPLTYAPSAIIRGKTASEIWLRDKLKMETATNLGFTTMVVWESEFNADKVSTINKVKLWMS